MFTLILLFAASNVSKPNRRTLSLYQPSSKLLKLLFDNRIDLNLTPLPVWKALAGIAPVNWLFLKSRWVIDEGKTFMMGPVSLLLYRLSCTRKLRLPIVAGRDPVNSLDPKSSTDKLSIFPMESGKSPVSSLLARSSSRRVDVSVSFSGKVPESLLSLM